MPIPFGGAMSESHNDRLMIKMISGIEESLRRIALSLEQVVDLAEGEVTLNEETPQERRAWDEDERIPDFMKGEDE